MIQQVQGIKVDLLICCGDFQCLRSTQDYAGLACPDKYKTLVRDNAKPPASCTYPCRPVPIWPAARVFAKGAATVSIPLPWRIYLT